jgi:hypothetical protein
MAEREPKSVWCTNVILILILIWVKIWSCVWSLLVTRNLHSCATRNDIIQTYNLVSWMSVSMQFSVHHSYRKHVSLEIFTIFNRLYVSFMFISANKRNNGINNCSRKAVNNNNNNDDNNNNNKINKNNCNNKRQQWNLQTREVYEAIHFVLAYIV